MVVLFEDLLAGPGNTQRIMQQQSTATFFWDISDMIFYSNHYVPEIKGIYGPNFFFVFFAVLTILENHKISIISTIVTFGCKRKGSTD